MINYFDLGLYQGKEIEMIVSIFNGLGINDYRIYGFEAFPKFYEYCKRIYTDRRIQLYNVAINDRNEKIKLYLSNNNEGHSIYSTKNNVNENIHVDVDGIVFSDWLREYIPNLENDFNIIKCNIEGAEWKLINDLKDNELLKQFNIYCGKWDDVEKIDELKNNVDDYYDIFKQNGIIVHRFSKWKSERNADLSTLIKEGLVNANIS